MVVSPNRMEPFLSNSVAIRATPSRTISARSVLVAVRAVSIRSKSDCVTRVLIVLVTRSDFICVFIMAVCLRFARNVYDFGEIMSRRTKSAVTTVDLSALWTKVTTQPDLKTMKTKVLSLRMEEIYHQFLDELESKTHIERANLMRALIDAAREFFLEHGYFQMPFRIVAAEVKR